MVVQVKKDLWLKQVGRGYRKEAKKFCHISESTGKGYLFIFI